MAAQSSSTGSNDEPPDDALDNGRILSLSDGVFAFALTLMVLQFDTPEPAKVAASALSTEVLEQWPSFVAYAITFFVIANYWAVHHRTFRYIRSHDATVIWINILFLLCISFLPFPTDVMGEYDQAAFATIFYALWMTVTSLVLTGLWAYVGHQRRLLHDTCDADTIRYNVCRGLFTAGVFLFSMPFTAIDADLARVTWLLLFPGHYLLARQFPRIRRDAIAV